MLSRCRPTTDKIRGGRTSRFFTTWASHRIPIRARCSLHPVPRRGLFRVYSVTSYCVLGDGLIGQLDIWRSQGLVGRGPEPYQPYGNSAMRTCILQSLWPLNCTEKRSSIQVWDDEQGGQSRCEPKKAPEVLTRQTITLQSLGPRVRTKHVVCHEDYRPRRSRHPLHCMRVCCLLLGACLLLCSTCI